MESAKNVRWIIPFKKFGMVRVNNEAGDRYKIYIFHACKVSLNHDHINGFIETLPSLINANIN